MNNHTTRNAQRKFTQEEQNEICRRYNTPNEAGDYPTLVGMGVEYGCSETTIRNILTKHGIKTRPNVASYSRRMFDKETEIAICEYYWTKLPTGYYPSYKEVGEKFGCTGNQVPNLLKRHGYESRTNAETRDHRPCKPINQPDSPAPLCACGCGTPVQWKSNERRWFKFAPGHYKPKKLYHDPEWLRREYHDKKRSLADIAAQFSVGLTSIRGVMEKHGIETRTTGESLILRGSVSGPNNPAWKGGVAKWNYSPDWKRLCKEIKDRDKWTCQLCGERRKRWGHRLHVHHIDEDKMNNHPHNLISLCAACHAPLHGNEDIRPILVEIAMRNTNG